MLHRAVWIAALAGLCASGAFAGGGGGPMTAVIDGKEVSAPEGAAAMGDPLTVQRILDEGKNHNQTMAHMEHLTKQIGPRLTGSTRARTANEWARDQYALWGLANSHLEQWGSFPVGFDRGPCSGKIFLKHDASAAGGRRGGRPGGTGPGAAGGNGNGGGGSANNLTAPTKPLDGAAGKSRPAGDKPEEGKDEAPPPPQFDEARTMEFTTPAWSRGTDGAVRGVVVKEPKTDAEFEAVKDRLKGAWVLVPPRDESLRGVRTDAPGRRQIRDGARKKVAEGTKTEELTVAERIAVAGVAGYVMPSRDERVRTQAAPGYRDMKGPESAAQDIDITVRRSDYDFINSRLSDGETVQVEFDLQHRLFTAEDGGPVPTYNTIAEIRGSTWPEQVVIVSAHIDSWDGPGSEGCTDNGTGTVVTLEAARILAAAGAQPKRTIRFINWTGEEEGLLGSKAYVAKHKDEMANVSAVFVDDGGTNWEGGLECVETMAPMLAAATAPLNNLFYDDVTGKVMNVNVHISKNMPKGGASDHASFNAVGVPGFYWDEVGRADYQFGWHTQNDKMSLAIPRYLEQSSTCVALTAYRLACADSMLPREIKEEAPPKKDDDKPKAEAASRQ